MPASTRVVPRRPDHSTRLPFVLEYLDRRGWREWSGYNGTLSAAWDAHTIFGAKRPEATA